MQLYAIARSWYDAHREAILRGGTGFSSGGDEPEEPGVNVRFVAVAVAFGDIVDDGILLL